MSRTKAGGRTKRCHVPSEVDKSHGNHAQNCPINSICTHECWQKGERREARFEPGMHSKQPTTQCAGKTTRVNSAIAQQIRRNHPIKKNLTCLKENMAWGEPKGGLEIEKPALERWLERGSTKGRSI